MLLAAGAWWVLRQPFFPLAGIKVDGEVTHNNAVTLRANVAPQLAGNFFTVDLARARSAFESVPWVRKAVVRREFPNKLRATLTEHVPVAHWGDEADSRLINGYGEVFEANVAEVDDALPRLDGPTEQAGQVLGMYRVLPPLFQPYELAIEQLTLSSRGSWRVVLDTGARARTGPRRRARRWRRARSASWPRWRRSPASTAATSPIGRGRGPAAQRGLRAAVARRHHGRAPTPRRNSEEHEDTSCPRNTKTWSSASTSAPPR